MYLHAYPEFPDYLSDSVCLCRTVMSRFDRDYIGRDLFMGEIALAKQTSFIHSTTRAISIPWSVPAAIVPGQGKQPRFSRPETELVERSRFGGLFDWPRYRRNSRLFCHPHFTLVAPKQKKKTCGLPPRC